ncbi:MAG: EI24 domain-containing protein [Saprospiraceae bacterium]|nr:EI24 domain-containing protein [Saprospiraceae bacterium]
MLQVFDIIRFFTASLVGTKSGVKKYILYTGISAILLCGVVIYAGLHLSGLLGKYLASIIPWQWAHESLMFSFIVGLATFVFVFMIFKYILIILLSPLLSYISEKTESEITGTKNRGAFSFIQATSRSIRINLLNMAKELIISSMLFLISFIPMINIISLPMLLMVQAYFTGFGFMDFYMERHYSFSKTIEIVYQHKWAAMTLGSIFILMFTIPIIGILFAPYLTVVVGTRYFAARIKSIET